jgi:tRNA threonylcarbamoyladenosine biosynthesis protein TsaE
MATDIHLHAVPGTTVSRSVAETAAVARSLLPLMRESGFVSLEGPLGAGKTHFVKAVAALMGIGEPVSSPTFTLLHSYHGGIESLHHSDWYRLQSEDEVLALGLEEYLGEGLLLVEWGDKFPSLIPPGSVRIRIETAPDESRLIRWERTAS